MQRAKSIALIVLKSFQCAENIGPFSAAVGVDAINASASLNVYETPVCRQVCSCVFVCIHSQKQKKENIWIYVYVYIR